MEEFAQHLIWVDLFVCKKEPPLVSDGRTHSPHTKRDHPTRFLFAGPNLPPRSCATSIANADSCGNATPSAATTATPGGDAG
jgi:hypothetical protein